MAPRERRLSAKHALIALSLLLAVVAVSCARQPGAVLLPSVADAEAEPATEIEFELPVETASSVDEAVVEEESTVADGLLDVASSKSHHAAGKKGGAKQLDGGPTKAKHLKHEADDSYASAPGSEHSGHNKHGGSAAKQPPKPRYPLVDDEEEAPNAALPDYDSQGGAEDDDISSDDSYSSGSSSSSGGAKKKHAKQAHKAASKHQDGSEGSDDEHKADNATHSSKAKHSKHGSDGSSYADKQGAAPKSAPRYPEAPVEEGETEEDGKAHHSSKAAHKSHHHAKGKHEGADDDDDDAAWGSDAADYPPENSDAGNAKADKKAAAADKKAAAAEKRASHKAHMQEAKAKRDAAKAQKQQDKEEKEREKQEKHEEKEKEKQEKHDAGDAGGDHKGGHHGKHGSKHGHSDDAELNPVPQPPSEVCDVLVASGSFVWTTLAAEGGDGAAGQGAVPYYPTLRAPKNSHNGHHGSSSSSSGGGYGGSSSSSSGSYGASSGSSSGSSSGGSSSSSSGHGGSSSNGGGNGNGGGNTCGVTNPSFLLPTNCGAEDTSLGFYGASDSDASAIPTDEALIVGPVQSGHAYSAYSAAHPHHHASGKHHGYSGSSDDKASARRYVVHAVNRVAEIFIAYSNGTLIPAAPGAPSTRLSLSAMMVVTGCPSVAQLVPGEPSGYYDRQSNRFVLVWLATAPAFDAAPLLFMAVSDGSDPTGAWVVRALRVKPAAQVFACPVPGVHSADVEPFFATYPQVTYSADGVYVSLGLVCSAGAASSSHHAASASFRSAIYAYSKAALYASASAESGSGFRSVFAALWISEKAWYRSVPAASAGLLSAGMLNNFVQPVRPQSLEDVFNGPFFVQKVDCVTMSLGALVSTSRLATMVSIATAPRLIANLFERGGGLDFAACGPYEGANVMRQPDTTVALFAGDTGMVGRSYAVRSYGAVLFEGSVYLTTSEFFGGEGEGRLPSIYWAIVDPGSTHALATGAITVTASGVIASRDGLALGFPVIAAQADGQGAVVAYAYSGAGVFADGAPTFAGVATTTVSVAGGAASASIDIVHRGKGSITARPHGDRHGPARYGDYSAADIIDGNFWFAVPTTRPGAAGGSGSYGHDSGSHGKGHGKHGAHHGKHGSYPHAASSACYASWISVRCLE